MSIASAITGIAAPASQVEHFLWRCGRDTLSAPALAELRVLAEQFSEADWRSVCAAARREGVAPLAFKHLASAGLLTASPPQVVYDLKHAYAVSLVGNRVRWGELRAILKTFEERGLDAVPLKGVSLALRAYSESALRPAGDTDMLVRPSEVSGCAEALSSLGYAPQAGSERLTADHALRFHELVFRKPGKPPVELHTVLARAPSYRRSLPVSEIWSRSRRFSAEGTLLRRLHPYDELLYLCLHFAAQHNFDRLLWLVDIAQLSATLPSEWNWDEFAREVVTRRAATPVALTLERAQAHLGAEIPPEVLVRLRFAAHNAREQAAWRLAHVAFSDPRRASLHLLGLPTLPQRFAFGREMLSVGLRKLLGPRHVGTR